MGRVLGGCVKGAVTGTPGCIIANDAGVQCMSKCRHNSRGNRWDGGKARCSDSSVGQHGKGQGKKVQKGKEVG